jgi:hypothetical protein
MEAGQRLGSALPSMRDAAQATLDTLTKLSQEIVEMEFGLKLAGRRGVDPEDERLGHAATADLYM